jgi:23S rRNA (guanosine2251-2'-O)-methyltransferase
MSRSDKYNKVEFKQKADTISKDTQAEETSRFRENYIEGRNAVLEAFRSGKTIDKLYVLDGCQDGPVKSITREAQKSDTIVYYVTKERLDQLSETGKHQGVIAVSAAYAYAEVEDILEAAKAKGEAPFLFLLDGIEDPHNLGAILRTANLCGAHGVIIPKRRAVGLTPTVAKTSAGAINYTPVAKVTNLTDTIRKLKDQGMWFVCADMGGTEMYDLDLTGPIGLVIGNEGEGVSKLVKENCDMIASIPMKGDIDSLNASVACGVMAYEIVRQRIKKG